MIGIHGVIQVPKKWVAIFEIHVTGGNILTLFTNFGFQS